MRPLDLEISVREPLPRPLTVPAALLAGVERDPSRPAIRDPRGVLTYGELYSRAAGLATLLRRETEPDRPVLILATPGTGEVTAMVGAAVAGILHVVIDASLPDPAAGALASRFPGATVVTDRECESRARILGGDGAILRLDDTPSADEFDVEVAPDTPLFVSFTSGTSGQPKGVEHSHRAAILNAVRVRDAFDVSADDGLLALTPFAYVGGLTPLFASLVSGSTLCVHVLSAEGVAGVRAFAESAGATIASVGPGRVRAIAEQARRNGPFTSVRLVLVGGDRFEAGQAVALAEAFPAARIVQRYSLSETNWVAGCEIEPAELDPSAPVPLGWPVPWLGFTSEDGQGVVTGDALALGYWADPVRTAEMFHGNGSDRSFRSGDRVTVNEDGLLWFEGRADRTTKVNGVLVDLVEVEQALESIDGVLEARVVMSDAPGVGARLAAFVVADGRVRSGSALRRLLAGRLPRSRVPAAIELVDALPINPRGKVDTEVLEARADGLLSSTSPAPVEPGERAIADVVAHVLDREHVGRDDDIFGLGADSLDTMEIIAALEPIIGRRLDTSDLLEHPTPAELAPLAVDRVPLPRGLIRVRRGEPGAVPLILCPGGGGGGLEVMAAIGRGLGPRDVFVPVPRGYEQRAAPDRTIEEMAATLVADVRAVLGDAPVALAGHSSGGVVAFEAAQQLAALGVPVSVLVLIDTTVPGTGAASRRRRARAAEVRLQRRGPMGSLYAQLRSRVRPGRLWRSVTAGRVMRHGDTQQYTFSVVRGRAIDRYRPRLYAGQVVILRANGTDPVWASDPDAEPPRDLSLWRRHLSREPVVLDLSGGHESVVTSGHRAETMAVLADALERWAGGP